MIPRGLLLFTSVVTFNIVSALSPCDISTGRNAIILNITESVGNDFSQTTSPQILPIEGETPGEINLSLSTGGEDFFLLRGKSLVLKAPLDRDAKDLSTIRFEVTCGISASAQTRSIPIVVRVLDINDNRPSFVDAPYHITLPEDNSVGSPVFRGVHATDADAGLNGQVEYEVFSPSGEVSESDSFFRITFPHQGVVFLTQPLDYEKQNVHYINILATDYSNDISSRMNSTTTLTVHVQDVDDQDPVFDTAAAEAFKCPVENPDCQGTYEYWSTVIEAEVSGVLDIHPGRIHAKDLDSIRASMSYSFVSGSPPSFRNYFEIDARTAVINQKRAVDQDKIKSFEILIQAEERTPRRGRKTARLLIDVIAVDTSPPQLIASSTSGSVKELSAVGTPVAVVGGSGEPLVLIVRDPDDKPNEVPPDYIFELTTSAFTVNPDGVLVVANPNLDRDPPNPDVYTFQAFARSEREGSASSAPVTITVRLIDINDNKPRLPIYPVATISAGDQRRQLMKVTAIDLDEEQNSGVKYSIVSGNSGSEFSVEAQSGVIWAEGDLIAGQNYVLNIRATDVGGLFSDGLLEISVSRGPNTAGPQFQETLYSASVPEDAPFGTSIMTVKAIDPEGDVPHYSIAPQQKGVEGVFSIDTLLGVITVVSPLDRESRAIYDFSIQAKDSEGETTSTGVRIVVSDVNDQPPMWKNDPYSFRVDEGIKNQPVGVILAEDADSGNAGRVSYSLEIEQNSNFKINSSSGQIVTKMALDYEEQRVHYLSVVAHDLAQDSLSSTATVTVLVNDLSDEVPVFEKNSLEVVVPEDTEIGTVLITVSASDPDTVPTVTYTMIEGDQSKFRVGPNSGRVTLTAFLDFEEKDKYHLLIGTEQNTKDVKGSRIAVSIEVTDVNDNSPVLRPLSAVTFPRSASVGMLLINASASDADSTDPNNKLNFQLVSEDDDGVPLNFFKIDPYNGEIRLLNSLEDLNATEIMMKVIVSDNGSPIHSDSESFRIILLRGIEEISSVLSASDNSLESLPVALMPRFSKTDLNLKVQENIEIGSIIVKIPLVNMTTSLACSILDGNSEDTFSAEISVDGTCKIRLANQLDYESRRGYNLSLGLHPQGIIINSEDDAALLSTSFVEVNVENVNDNSPKFILDGMDAMPTDGQMNTVISYVLQTSPVDTRVMEFKAMDFDSGVLGHITYELIPASNRGNYFSINQKSGRLSTQRKLNNVPAALQPFNITLVASDSTGVNGVTHDESLNIIIPIIEESHRLVLLIDSTREAAQERIPDINRALSEMTGKSAHVEQLRHNVYHPGSESSAHHVGPVTQVWFHLLDTNTWLPIDPSYLTAETKQSHFLSDVSHSLDGISPIRFMSPNDLILKSKEKVEESPPILSSSGDSSTTVSQITSVIAFGAVEYVLLVLAAIIILFVIGAIITLCILWGRFSKNWRKADQMVMLIPPVLERPESVLDAVAKEYEVQVLHMSVPLDDDSVQDYPEDQDSPRLYCLDNVSYISKSQNGLDGSSSGDPPSSGRVTPGVVNEEQQEVISEFTPWATSGHQTRPYDAYGGDHTTSEIDPAFSASSTNENVMFGRSFQDPSPVETTTEL